MVMVSSAHTQNIPTNNWIYSSISKMQVLDLLSDLPTGSIPYSRTDIAKSLIDCQETGAIAHRELALLKSEFKAEMGVLEAPSNSGSDKLFLNAALSHQVNNSIRPILRSSVGLSYAIKDRIVLQWNGVIDESFVLDSSYQTYTWRGMAGYQDQAFISFYGEHLNVLVGRDYLKWGRGNSGGLFITDNSRPLDMIKGTIKSSNLRFEFLVSQLDQMYGADRYLSASRLSFSILKKMEIGLGQSALYGGLNKPIDFTLSNPLSFYSFSQDNDQKYMNGMLYLDWEYKALRKSTLYGEILIDDYQIDSEVKADLEPAEYGILLGVKGVNIFGRLDGWMEYSEVRNRTYNVPEIRPWEKFLHRGVPIAHQLGNNFRFLAFELETWLGDQVLTTISLEVIEKGEGSIIDVFDEPWLDPTLDFEDGYEEAFPFGLVERSIHSSLVLRYTLGPGMWLETYISNYHAAGHSLGNELDTWNFGITSNFEFNPFWQH